MIISGLGLQVWDPQRAIKDGPLALSVLDGEPHEHSDCVRWPVLDREDLGLGVIFHQLPVLSGRCIQRAIDLSLIAQKHLPTSMHDGYITLKPKP